MKQKTHVIGAGISGLGAAHFLQQRSADVVVHEAADKPGGRAGYAVKEGRCLEYGGKNFASDWRLFNGLATEFGLSEKDVQHPNFHIVLNDKLIGLDKKQTLTSGLSMVRSIGLGASFEFNRLLKEAKKHAHGLNYTDGVIKSVEADYDHAPISELFNPNLAYGPLRMFSIIMGGAEPEETYLSQIMLFLASFGKGSHHSVTGGIKQLFDALRANKEINFGTQITRIEIEKGRVSKLHFKKGRKTWEEPATSVISALPLHVLLKLIDLPDDIRAEAEKIRYFPLALINAVYDQDVFDQRMNSIMFHQGSILGHCSANRMYQKNHVRFTLSGRAARSVLHLEDEALIHMAEMEFRKFHPINGKIQIAHVQRHTGGICAYAPHFTDVKKRLLDHISTIQGLEIAGDYLEGHNMEGCLSSAELAVKRLTGETSLTLAA